MSLPQMPQARTRTSTSSAPTSGTSMSVIVRRPYSVSSSDFINSSGSLRTPRTSEDDLRRELDVARKIVLARHLAEVGVGRIRVRVVEHHAIERVEELDVELRAPASADGHLLDDRDVPQVEERAPDAVDPGREVAHVVREANPCVGALLDGIVHAVGLYQGVVEIEPADVEYRDVAVVRVLRLQR